MVGVDAGARQGLRETCTEYIQSVSAQWSKQWHLTVTTERPRINQLARTDRGKKWENGEHCLQVVVYVELGTSGGIRRSETDSRAESLNVWITSMP